MLSTQGSKIRIFQDTRILNVASTELFCSLKEGSKI